MVNKKMINKWTFDRNANEIAFFNDNGKCLRELAKMPFYEHEYNKLPQDDKECFNYLFDRYKRYYKDTQQERKERAFLEKEFARQQRYIKPVQYYLENVHSTMNGYCYKDEKAFETGKGICYISEHELEDLENGKPLIDCMNTKATIKRDCKLYSNGKKIDPAFVFEMIDWQCPASLICELDD